MAWSLECVQMALSQVRCKRSKVHWACLNDNLCPRKHVCGVILLVLQPDGMPKGKTDIILIYCFGGRGGRRVLMSGVLRVNCQALQWSINGLQNIHSVLRCSILWPIYRKHSLILYIVKRVVSGIWQCIDTHSFPWQTSWWNVVILEMDHYVSIISKLMLVKWFWLAQGFFVF